MAVASRVEQFKAIRPHRPQTAALAFSQNPAFSITSGQSVPRRPLEWHEKLDHWRGFAISIAQTQPSTGGNDIGCLGGV